MVIFNESIPGMETFTVFICGIISSSYPRTPSMATDRKAFPIAYGIKRVKDELILSLQITQRQLRIPVEQNTHLLCETFLLKA
ncbi:hypothetical protein QE439_003282 [Pedobacter agri]|nr:hypothetical protein [Pedobacter agri]